MNTCSCGCTAAHIILTRETFDGITVSIWSDGALTTGRSKLGVLVRGLGQPRSNYARGARRAALKAIADDLGILALSEIPAAVKIAEKTFAHTWSSEDARRAFIRTRMAA